MNDESIFHTDLEENSYLRNFNYPALWLYAEELMRVHSDEHLREQLTKQGLIEYVVHHSGDQYVELIHEGEEHVIVRSMDFGVQHDFLIHKVTHQAAGIEVYDEYGLEDLNREKLLPSIIKSAVVFDKSNRVYELDNEEVSLANFIRANEFLTPEDCYEIFNLDKGTGIYFSSGQSQMRLRRLR